MARMRRLSCLVVLATVALSASGCGTGIAEPGRASATSGPAARTTPRDLVRPFQTHPDYAASARRNERERVDKTPLGTSAASARFHARSIARAEIGAAAHDTATRVTGSRAPPVNGGLQLR